VDAPSRPSALPSAPAPTVEEATGRFHSRAWLLWLLAAFTPAVLTKNPWYLLLTLAAVGTAHLRLSGLAGDESPAAWGSLLRLGLVLALFAALFPPLFVRAGETTLVTLPSVAFTLPLPTDPPPVLQIGGPVSLESVVYGLVTGLALVAILLTFATFSAGADAYSMLRSIPRFLHRSGVVLSIAVTFVPQMITAQREIREAQALRGHRFRGLRDLTPLFVTLLAEALDRSITLAESLEARGFGGTPQSDAAGGERAAASPRWSRELATRSTIAGSLVLLVGGAFLRGWAPQRRGGDLLLMLGAVSLVASLWSVGRRVRRSRWRRQPWRRRDSLVAAAAVASLGLLAARWLSRPESFVFEPYPRLGSPGFDPWIALALVLLATPALAATGRDTAAADGP
jgi:energy-coupling factor transport system permease protein